MANHAIATAFHLRLSREHEFRTGFSEDADIERFDPC